MREDIEKILSDELDKTQPSIENIYEPIEEDINRKIDEHNKKLESELVEMIESDSKEKDVAE